jgi:pilus assembly protein CpaE
VTDVPTIVERNPADAAVFASATGSGSDVVATLEELKQHLTATPSEYAVVLGPAVDLEAAAAFADTLRLTRPGTSVILVRRRVDTSVLAEALRSGMREVIEERDLPGLAEAVRRAADLWAALNGSPVADSLASTGKLFTVFSPKGGVGKTTLAVNLAVALANEDRRVCLVDLDLAFGDVAITLQMYPSRTIADAAQLRDLDVDTLQSLLTPLRNNMFALVAPVQPDAKEAIPAPVVGNILRMLKGAFDFVVVDTAPAFDEHVLQAFDESDTILLVTTLDVPTLKNVKMATETLDLLNFGPTQQRLILNRADEKVGLTADKVASTLNMKILAAIPTSPQVPACTNAGEPIMLSAPRHSVSLAISALAEELAGAPAPEAREQNETKRHVAGSGRRRLLRRTGG